LFGLSPEVFGFSLRFNMAPCARICLFGITVFRVFKDNCDAMCSVCQGLRELATEVVRLGERQPVSPGCR
jgi:hypothetical protein